MEYNVKIISIDQVAPRVKCIRVEKPDKFIFVPGHAMMISLNKVGWEKEKRSFTITSTNSDPYIEFNIKSYPENQGVTKQLHNLVSGDKIILSDMFGSFRYTKPGVFIAGGQGITPFLAIFRQLKKENKLKDHTLIYTAKTKNDIIHEEELKNMLGKNLIIILTQEKKEGYHYGRIDKEFLENIFTDKNTPFYVCGPDDFVKKIKMMLSELRDYQKS